MLEANDPQDTVWHLQRAIDGTRDAVASWRREYTRTWRKTIGFEAGVSNAVLVRCEKLDACTVAHGMIHVMSSHCTISERAILGADRNDTTEMLILSR